MEPVELQTWKDYELAAAERLVDAQVLAGARSDTSGAVYLAGYVAEMVLKAAFFRVKGTPVSANAGSQLALLHRAASAAGWGSAKSRPDYHNLDMLSRALLFERSRAGRPLGHAHEVGLRRRVRDLSAIWKVDLRYSHRALQKSDVGTAFRCATWFLANYPALHA